MRIRNGRSFCSDLDACAFCVRKRARRNSKKRETAQIYLAMSGDKRLSLEDLVKMLENPEYRFTLEPEGVMKYATFMASTGVLKKKPANWKELFFPHVHRLPGS